MMETPPLQPASATAPREAGDVDFNPVPGTEGPEAEQDAGLCPKCHQALIDPQGLGWCKGCGYCKSLEEDKARVPLETKKTSARQPSVLGVVEFGQMMGRLPDWAWVLIGGAAGIAVLSLPVGMLLESSPLARAICSTLEIALGVITIIAAQIWALCLLAPNDDKLHFKDAILPGRLWGQTLGKLPEMRVQVWLVGWGLAAILSAVLVTGGLGHWLTYLPKKAPPAVEQTTAVEQPAE
jgi:hypothetical protein